MKKNDKGNNLLALQDGTIIEAPRGIQLTDRVTHHKNIVYVDRKEGGWFYLSTDRGWKILTKTVRNYFVGEKSLSMPEFYDDMGYVMFNKSEDFGKYRLMDCETGKEICCSEEIFKGMEKDHSNSCFITKDWKKNKYVYCVIGPNGEILYQTEGNLTFKTEKSISGIYFIRENKPGTMKEGLLRVFKGKLVRVFDNKYDRISIRETVEDRNGNLYTPSIEVENEGVIQLYDMNGVEIKVAM